MVFKGVIQDRLLSFFLATIIGMLFFCQAALADSDMAKKHVFYLHGAIIEKGDPKPIHPQYGLYDYPAIVAALSRFGFTLISEQRAIDTDYLSYAQKLSEQITTLIANGTKAQDITVIGFSKGAMITVIASSLLKNNDVNFAIMATCGEWYETDEFLNGLRLHGHILSIYEESDLAGSCKKLAARSPAPSSFKEVSINTGKEHGAFYLPRSEWINPVVSWVKRETVNH
ncbi:hypothetical protein BST96_06740 [Oceanicoccus sagamiensis]|uniref:Phospholipase/carboxylesterase/thioesterase domain-containing protein n=1 Tax=Oceanicoccus sagamiensis TaxID=716816 RepID=A0A1X9NFN5_9GAMM|nr:hypothetical protein BST96_06740 [Oceanicoccus sagamiensis]